MRFNEFKIVEAASSADERTARRTGKPAVVASQPAAATAEAPKKIYSIGDSHAEGLSYDKRLINYAHGGQPSTSKSNYSGNYKGHPTGIENVPEGSFVVIAQGANDTANSARAFIDSKGKTPLVPPAKIASNVAAIVSAAKSRKCKVVFVLFPNGNGRAPGLAKYYSGDYQDEVRQAIKSAVGVPVVDLEGKGLSPDGIHGSPSAYLSAAKEAIELLGAPTKQSGQKTEPAPTPAPAPTKDDSTGGLAVPTNLWKSDETRAIQQALVDLGYDFPRSGVDGYFGPETAGVVRQFQKDNGLKVDGDPGPETVAALNKKLRLPNSGTAPKTTNPVLGGGKPKPKQSGMINPNPNRSRGMGTNFVNKGAVSSYLKSKGMSDNHRIGILANIQGESSFDSANQTGDGGTAWGLFQWRLDRQDNMVKFVGPDWKTNWKGQIDFALQEPAGRRYLATKFRRYEEAVEQWVRDFERPKHPWEDTLKRIDYAKEFIRSA